MLKRTTINPNALKTNKPVAAVWSVFGILSHYY